MAGNNTKGKKNNILKRFTNKLVDAAAVAANTSANKPKRKSGSRADVDGSWHRGSSATSLLARCVREEEGWTKEYARRVLKSYVQWLCMKAQAGDLLVSTPPGPIDTMWRHHTQLANYDGTTYEADCRLICGEVVRRRNPKSNETYKVSDSGSPGKEDLRIEKTRELLFRRYTINEIDVEIWKEIVLSSIVSHVLPFPGKDHSSSHSRCSVTSSVSCTTEYTGTGIDSPASYSQKNSTASGSYFHRQQLPQDKRHRYSQLDYIQIFVQLPIFSSGGRNKNGASPRSPKSRSRLTSFCVRPDYTVGALKAMVEEHCVGAGGDSLLPADRQQLVYCSSSGDLQHTIDRSCSHAEQQNELQDHQKLSHYGIDCESTILCRYVSR